jgi:hypothetical protein
MGLYRLVSATLGKSGTGFDHGLPGLTGWTEAASKLIRVTHEIHGWKLEVLERRKFKGLIYLN